MANPEIHGSCDEGFGAVREAFAANFRDHDEVGAAVAVTVDGRRVVDLWAGWADEARTRPWERDTLVDVFSTGKAVVAFCLLRLVERGEADLDAPVARYWPEFAAAGKDAVTVRMLLAHRAGLPAIRRLLPPETIYDWDRMCSALAAEEPWWEPDTRHGYHANSYGFLVGEVVRRVSGARVGAFLRREVSGPLGADFHFGLNPSEDGRVAEFLFRVGAEEHAAAELGAEDVPPERLLQHRAYLNPPGISGLGTVNTRAFRGAEIPSANGHASARALTRIYTALACGGAVDGVRVLEEATIAEATAEASAGMDVVLDRPSRFGLGFQLTQPERPLGPNPRSFGHFGFGGALGFADPDARLAFGYAMNRSGPRWQNPRNRALVEAVYSAL